jgi:type I restriction enzyme S subunit
MRQEQLINLPIDWKRGNGLRKSDLDEDGKYRCILYGELYTKHKKPLIENRDLSRTNKSGVFYSKKGDILVPGTSTASRKDMLLAREIDEDGVILGGDINIIRPKQGLFAKKYLPYFFDTFSAYDQLDRYITGATGIIHISNTGLKKLKVPLPTYQEQQRIVSILDECFAALAIARANAEQNLKNARELFESFLQDLFMELFKQNKNLPIASIANVISGYSFKSSDFKKEGTYQVIRMGNVRPGVIREEENPVFINKMEKNILNKALLQLNDVIITQTGTKKKRDYGYTAIIEKENYLLNQRIAAIRFSDKYLPKFFLYFSWTSIFKDQYFANETGTVGQGNVGIGAITDSLVPFLPLSEQHSIVNKLDNLCSETKRLETIYQHKLNSLEELKKSILQKAFNGELKTESLIIT